jgi:hypothetical protein
MGTSWDGGAEEGEEDGRGPKVGKRRGSDPSEVQAGAGFRFNPLASEATARSTVLVPLSIFIAARLLN